MSRRFTVIDTFHSEDMQCDYVAGMSYEVTDDNEKMIGLIDQWIADGKVREGGPQSEVSGAGEVVEKEGD